MPTKEYYAGLKRKRKSSMSSNVSVRVACGIMAMLTLASAGWSFKSHSDVNKLQQEIAQASKVGAQKDIELSVLRAINPFQYKYSQLLESTASSQDLMPGWVVRIYKTPNKLSDLSSMMDMGAFILDESKFTLASHENYGLESPGNVLYRLNGLIPSSLSGRFQVGVRLSFGDENLRNVGLPNQQSSCFARVDVNNKRVIESKVRHMYGSKEDALLTGNVVVNKGVHPITALLYCEDDSKFTGKDVQISLTFRDPGSNSFKTSAESVFHVYKHARS